MFNIPLEEAGKNRATKNEILKQFSDVDLEGKVKRRNRVAVWMEDVLQDSRSIPVSIANYRVSRFEDPTKWVVVFLGSFKDLFNLEALDIGSDPKTNLLIICMTNENIDLENVEYVKALVKMTNQGGFLIVKYNE